MARVITSFRGLEGWLETGSKQSAITPPNIEFLWYLMVWFVNQGLQGFVCRNPRCYDECFLMNNS